MSGLEVRLEQQRPMALDARIECAPGELLALVGPSGSGKSTILRCIAGLRAPQNGYVRCNGDVWYDSEAGVRLSPQKRRVGLVFQNYSLFPHLTAMENVTAALLHLPVRQRTERARALLRQVHLEGIEDRRPAQLSGGQQQRVAVARALARDPAVLLLDEPFSAVDQVTRGKLQRELARLRGSLRIPIVLVTHDLDEARRLADRICILHHGATLQCGTPHDVLSKPRNAGVARLVRLTNVFEGVLQAPAQHGVKGRLQWLGRALEVEDTGPFTAGSRVCWLIPPEHVILHQRVRPSRGERENPVSGIVGDCTTLGENTSITLLADDNPRCPIELSVPTHVAQRNRLRAGERIGVSLLAGGIHLMPWEPLAAAASGDQ